MNEKEAKEIIEKIVNMQNVASDMKHNTQDGEMARYFMGFIEGLDWVVETVLRNERIKYHLIVSQVEQKG
jgi:hypothetical protein